MSKPKNPHAVALGALGGHATAERLTPEQRRARARKAGQAGGPARAKKLTAKQRSAHARKMAEERWSANPSVIKHLGKAEIIDNNA